MELASAIGQAAYVDNEVKGTVGSLSGNKCSRETKTTMATSPAALLLRRGALFFKPAAFREEADLQ